MKSNLHADNQPESSEKARKSSGNGSKKPRKAEKSDSKKPIKETIEALHAAIAKETESSMDNLIVVAIVFFANFTIFRAKYAECTMPKEKPMKEFSVE